MAWAAKINGNGYFITDWLMPREAFTYTFTVVRPSSGVEYGLLGYRFPWDDYNVLGIFITSGGRLSVKCKVAAQGNDISSVVSQGSIPIGEEVTVSVYIDYMNSNCPCTFTVNGITNTENINKNISSSIWSTMDRIFIGSFFRGVSSGGVDANGIELIELSINSRIWSADGSNHSAGTNVLAEITPSNMDARGYNMPTDGSVWVNLGEDALSIALDIISSTLLMHSPKVLKDQKIALNTITSTADVSQPKVLKDKKVDLDSLVNVLTMYQPTIFKDKKITLSTIDSTVTIEEPKVLRAHTVSLNNINSTVSVEEPKVLKAKSVKLGTLNNFSFVHQPKLTGGLVIEIGSVSFRLQIQWQGLERL